ncbi:hypothetical protein QR680_016508 [Steinernema hermaphroditum]|uniref:Uncharacterized protein n=1 Tax=Steinernema hermaphroditum TaxID=289476 RepID=A0AA39HDL0_9BILA|nr:hypothetical protein QR680_016508 [Steinernema hermaphroditum]
MNVELDELCFTSTKCPAPSQPVTHTLSATFRLSGHHQHEGRTNAGTQLIFTNAPLRFEVLRPPTRQQQKGLPSDHKKTFVSKCPPPHFLNKFRDSPNKNVHRYVLT